MRKSSVADAYATAADHAYEVICDAILEGKLRPGEKLSRRKMAKLAGVSIIPVIEALHRLENEGLVESRPHWGSRVILLTDKTIRDRFAMREAVECQVVRMLSGQLTLLQREELQALAVEIDTLQQREELGPFWQKHYRFHLRMAEYTGCQSLVDALHRINLFSLLQRAEVEARHEPDKIPPDNHQHLVKVLVDGAACDAEEAMRSHIYQSRLVTPEMIYTLPNGIDS